MKKFFTLFAAVALAASVNAQGVYAVSDGEIPEGGSKIISVPNITMTWGEDTWKDNKKVDGKFEGMDYKVLVVQMLLFQIWFLHLVLM